MVVKSYNGDVLDEYDLRRAKENRVKLAILIVIGVLIAGFATWNIWRMVQAIQSPVVSVRDAVRSEIPVPGLVFCGLTLDQPIQCFKSAFNAADDEYNKGDPCDEYLSRERFDGTSFYNMYGFYNLTGQYCYIFDPRRPYNNALGPPLRYNNSTQKIALALWSSVNANNTLGAITIDEWYFFGIFTERENPQDVKFQIVKMPAISYLYFSRIEKKQNINLDVITGGGTGNTEYDPNADVELDTSFDSFAISGFGISPNLWSLFRIIPKDYKFDPVAKLQAYSIQIWFGRVEFTLLQLTANMGGFVSILSALYFILLGSRRVDPWGIIQRYVLKSVPPAYTPTVFPYSYTDTKHQQEEPLSNLAQAEALHPPGADQNSRLGFSGASTSTPSSVYQPSDIGIVPGIYHPQGDYSDPQIERLRNELRAEIQGTIAQEIGKLRVYLSKYYFRDLAPSE
ncbi:1278_t:CDS:2 [Ambispora leptoticha]|uniref:1278_t:CDS:1 n=1 Tax=Ambispora leptoticha TaxID=144679 RepID=A0A9N8ZLH6_9GLOM|nr:1278_t:CDS:2 [Ambispora leptoticha]